MLFKEFIFIYLATIAISSSSQRCSPSPLQQRISNADYVITAKVLNINRNQQQPTYSSNVEVIEVFKPPRLSLPPSITIDNFGNTRICRSNVNTNDTRILLFNGSSQKYVLSTSFEYVTEERLKLIRTAVQDPTGDHQLDSKVRTCSEIVCRMGATCSNEIQEGQCSCIDCHNLTKSEPVCASDLKVYSNTCQLERQSCLTGTQLNILPRDNCDTANPCNNITCENYSICRLESNGITDNNPTCRCPANVCSLYYNPICGNNNKTYYTQCHMIQDSCQNNITVIKSYGGECASDATDCRTFRCFQNGQCLNRTFGYYTCQCPLGYTGTYCHQDQQDAIPSFHDGSYIRFKNTSTWDREVNLTIEFMPSVFDGLILIGGNLVSSNGDYFALSLRSRYIEASFELGSGKGTASSKIAVEVNRWYRATVKRSGRDFTIQVNEEPPVVGKVPGSLSELNSLNDIYLGTLPSGLSTSNQFRSRIQMNQDFGGCIRSLDINNIEYNLNVPSSNKPDNVVSYYQLTRCVAKNPCSPNPCQNGGGCSPLSGNRYFQCACPTDYAGLLCERRSAVSVCASNPCPANSTCTHEAGKSDSWKCLCPLGKIGQRCDQVLQSSPFSPYFGGQSYLEYTDKTSDYFAASSVTINLKVKPLKPNGLIFYGSQREDNRGDFILLNLVEGYLEFRFDLGSGTAVIRSASPLTLNNSHDINITRNGRYGTMRIDQQPEVRGIASGSFVLLSLFAPFYFGGHPNFAAMNSKTKIKTGLVGCIESVTINGQEKQLVKDAIYGAGVSSCNDCQRKPCQNGGQCSLGVQGYLCNCPQYYTGENCSQAIEVFGPSVAFDGGNVYTLRNNISADEKEFNFNTIELQLKTFNLHGLILWSGPRNYSQNQRRPFIALAVTNGNIQLRFNLGTQDNHITSTVRINDGNWHTIKAYRIGRQANLTVDTEFRSITVSTGSPQIAVDGDLFLGGLNTTPKKNWNLYRYNYVGCIRNIQIQHHKVNIVTDLKVPQQHTTCEAFEVTGPSLAFDGRSAYPYLNNVDNRLTVSSIQSFQLSFKTLSSNGLILWHGNQKPGDFISVGIRNKFVELNYNLGSGTKTLTGGWQQVNDDKWHKVLVDRQSRYGNLTVDGRSITGFANPSATELNAADYLYLGGVENIAAKTSNLYYSFYEGCVKEVKLSGVSLNMQRDIQIRQRLYTCQQNAEFGPAYWFTPTSYITLLSAVTEKKNSFSSNRYEFLVRGYHNGLLLWLGQSQPNPNRDYLGVAIVNNRVQLRFNVGSGKIEIVVDVIVTDGYWHKVKIERNGSSGTLTVDGASQKSNPREGASVLNVDGNILIGGTPNIATTTSNKYLENYRGCLKNFVIDGFVVNLQLMATESVNTKSCPGYEPPVSFSGSKAVRYLSDVNRGLRAFRQNSLRLTFKTRKSTAVLFWLGNDNDPRLRSDYMSAAVEAGYFKIRYNLGGGATSSTILTLRVDDNQWHTVYINRNLTNALLYVDHLETSAISLQFQQELNVASYFYLGGVPENNIDYTSNDNFIGCMVNVEVNGKIVQLSDDAVDPNISLPRCQ
ncbi:Agrin [Trichoplax sp. H2]|nr:Agrin [Trichoplax sp. H2]|eukprot:RDD44249.1 Agrin [Trichoplax sp. H2]